MAARCPELDEVHLWQADLDVSAAQLSALTSSLSGEEKARAERLRRPIDRARWIASRGFLRQLLGGYLRVEPRQVCITVATTGKPRLTQSGACGPNFSLSHSSRVGLYAIACSDEVGVDVERVSGDLPIQEIADLFFTSAERDELAATPAGSRRRVFFECWTRKEAGLKLAGVGLQGLGAAPEMSRSRTVTSIQVAPGYVAAVATARLLRIPPRVRRLHVGVAETEGSSPASASVMSGGSAYRG